MNQSADRLSLTLSALADPTRRAILAKLVQGEATVKELSSPFALSGPAITKHLKVLEAAGLISRGRDAQRRPCRLEPSPLRDLDAWLVPYRVAMEQRLERLEEYLKTVVDKETGKEKSHGRKKKTE